MARIIWLASYPKSGNTWVRAFLTNYLRRAETPANINELIGAPIASSRVLFGEWAGMEASDLSRDAVARHRPEVYRRFAQSLEGRHYMKAHDAYRLPGGPPLFPTDVTAATIYIIRNPFDVAVSLAHHQRVSLDVAVTRMCSAYTSAPSTDGLPEQLEQVLLSWSDHVRSWVDEPSSRAHVVRYEDLLSAPAQTFTALLEAAGEPIDEERVASATAHSSFDVLKRQEEQSGFVERAGGNDVFFRHGWSGDGHRTLSAEQKNRIVLGHHHVMRRFGYLGNEGHGKS